MKKKIVAVVSLLAITVFSGMSMLTMVSQEPLVHRAWNVMIEKTMEQANALNSVSAIVFDFRGYDTFGEALVLFTAIFGVSAILRKAKKKEETK